MRMSNYPNERHRNPKDMIDEYNRTLGLVEDKEQLKNSTNDVNVRADFAKDMKPSEFTDNYTDNPADIPTDSETEMSPHYPETARFAKSHSIDENELRQNKGMGKVAKTDDTAKGE